jgi:large subunit ribosomal protein L4
MKLTIRDAQGNPAGELEVGFALLAGGRGGQAVHETVVAHLANRRRGTACTKTMGEVAGTGKKPWRQKGTGRARAGSFQSPLWVGGGVVFGPKPRDFGKKVPRPVRTLALRKALSERLQAGEVWVVDDLKLTSPKTREFVKVLAALQMPGRVLVVAGGEDRNLRLAARNVPGVDLTTGANLNTYQVLRYERLLFTKPGFEQVEGRLK